MTSQMKLLKSTDLGPTTASTPVRLAVGLQVRNAAGLKALARAVSTPDSSRDQHFLTPAGFVADYAPTGAQVQAVTSYLTQQGFTGVSVSSNRLYVSADGTAGQAESAFNTQLENFRLNGKTVYVNSTPADVPASLGGTVLSVLGLENIVSFDYQPIVNTKHVTPAVRTGASAATAPPTGACAFPPGTGTLPGTYPDCYGYNPQEFQKAYDATSTPTGSKTAIAIMAEGDLTQVVKDLRQEETAFGLPKVPYSIVPVGVPSTDISGADEWDLDTQYSSGMAEQVSHLYIYDTTSLTDSDIGLEFNKWVSQDVAQGASASFGECEEFPYLDGLLVTNDEAMNEAAAQGQTMHASAGDTGAACAVAPTNGVPESGPPQVNYPCSSPYIICVGGTTLYTNPDFSYEYNPALGAGYAGESAWQAGGGGISANEYSPYWQSCVTPGAADNARDVPDVSMDADENDGAVVDVDGTFEEIGGTSVSSPLALGVWARLESAHDNRLGFAGPRLYALYPKGTCESGAGVPPTTPLITPAYPFHDVFLEGNGVYNATPGYDLVTGLGSYDVGLVSKAICPDKDHDCDLVPNKDDK